jgi:hypothetical protein
MLQSQRLQISAVSNHGNGVHGSRFPNQLIVKPGLPALPLHKVDKGSPHP